MGLFDGWQGFDVQEERRIGRSQGEEIKLIKQVCGKLALGQSIDQIATDLLEDKERIQEIYDTAARFAPDYDADKIYDELHNADADESKTDELIEA